jgi:hypothetical protein
MFVIPQTIDNMFNQFAIAGRVCCTILIISMAYEIFRNRPVKTEADNQIMISSASREQVLLDKVVRLNELLEYQDTQIEEMQEMYRENQTMWLNITVYSNASLIGIFMIILASLGII